MSCADRSRSKPVDISRERRPSHVASLAARLSVAYFSMSFLLIVLSSGILYWGIFSALRWADDQVLDKRLLTLRAILQDPAVDEDYVGHEVSEDLEGPRRIFMRVVSDVVGLQVETPSGPAELAAARFPDLHDAPFDALHRGSIYAEDGQYFRFVAARVALAPGWQSPSAILQVAINTSLDEQLLGWFRRMLAALFCAAAIVCAVAARYLVNRELRPLQQITAAASKISMETLAYRLPLESLPTELHELACQFNNMLARLESAYFGLRQYADNIAHELRSPVNKMLLGCEVSLLKARTVNEYREALESVMEDCSRLSCIVQSLLFLARADNAQATILREEIDVARELDVVREYFDASAEGAGVALSVEGGNGLRIDVDRVLFQRAISNLVSNAIAHTPRSGSVRILATQRGETLTVKVDDTGVGIAPEHLPHVLDRFYRANEVRSAADERLGLGLSITRSIVELHGGNLSLKSKVGQGTCVTLQFPSSFAFATKINQSSNAPNKITASLL